MDGNPIILVRLITHPNMESRGYLRRNASMHIKAPKRQSKAWHLINDGSLLLSNDIIRYSMLFGDSIVEVNSKKVAKLYAIGVIRKT